MHVIQVDHRVHDHDPAAWSIETFPTVPHENSFCGGAAEVVQEETESNLSGPAGAFLQVAAHQGLAALVVEFGGGILCWRTGKFSCAPWNSAVPLDSLPAVVVIS
ncbi:hypothetical protein AB3S75_016911 [Citrus x aurantiifolia]